MSIKRIKCLLMSAMLLLCCSGCSFSGLSDNDLLQPPRATGARAEIQNLIESTTNGDYKLKYPQSGDYRTAIIMQDIDADGRDEAVAMYKSTKDNSSINIMFMNEVGGKWVSIGSFSNGNSDVDRLYFGDVDNDGVNEVIVGWSSYLSGGSQVTMYKYNNDSMTEVIVNNDTNYADMVFMDITNDGISDLVILTSSADSQSAQTAATARLYSCCANGEFSRVSEIKTNPNIISYSQIMPGLVGENVNALFIDGNTANTGELVTEVIYYSSKDNSLVAPLDTVQPDGTVQNATTRKTSSVCKDIDNDGIVEIPYTFTALLEDDKLTASPITKWYKVNYKDGKTKQVMQTVANYVDGFYFIIPDKWKKQVVPINDNTTRTTMFYEILAVVDSSDGAKGNEDISDSTVPMTLDSAAETPTQEIVPELGTEPKEDDGEINTAVEISKEPVLTIKVFSDKNWKNESAAKVAEGFKVLKQDNGLVYTYKLGTGANSNLILTDKEVSEYFKLINS